MRDRLIELIKKGNGGYHFNSLELIADHLLAEGVIVPPCKVGDVVYAPHWHWGTYIKGDIMPYQITNITITQNKKGEWTKKYRAMEIKNGKTIDWQLNFEFDELGKTLFLTREEAEKARDIAENGGFDEDGNRIPGGRVKAENDRVAAESLRVTDETSRANAEAGRVEAETARVKAEAERGKNFVLKETTGTQTINSNINIVGALRIGNQEVISGASVDIKIANYVNTQLGDIADRLDKINNGGGA
jgi:hypothetical protein